MVGKGAQEARAESLFREVNERIAETAEVGPLDDGAFVCECGDLSCTAHVQVTLDDYEDVRSEPTHFIVRPGHAEPAVERVVEQGIGYDVVEKDEEEAAAVAEQLDPRP